VVAPERLRELVAWDRSAVLGDEVCEEKAALPTRQAPLVDHHTVGLDGNATREEDLQASLLVDSYRESCSYLAGDS
jgi:hypothetical protein